MMDKLAINIKAAKLCGKPEILITSEFDGSKNVTWVEREQEPICTTGEPKYKGHMHIFDIFTNLADHEATVIALEVQHGVTIRYDPEDESNMEGWRAVRENRKAGELYSIAGRNSSRIAAIAAAAVEVGND